MITKRDELDAAAAEVFDAIAETRGVVRGPYGALLHIPEIAEGAQRIGRYLRYGGTLPAPLRETVILATATLWNCSFEWYAHREHATKAGVDAKTLALLEAGDFDDLTGDQRLAARYARALVREGRVPAELFEAARARWSTKELVELSSLVGYYSCIALILNSFEITG